MPYGMEILTTNGMVDITGLRTARLHFSASLSGRSGTITIPGFDIVGGFICFQTLGGLGLVTGTAFNNSTKVFTWTALAGTASPSSFILMALRFD